MPINLEVVPEPLRKRVGPEAPEAGRMMMARAVLPMPPADLFAVLAFLVTTASGELQATARKSLVEMPRVVLDGILKGGKNPDLLEFALHQLIDDEKYTQILILNNATPDVAIEWAARRVRGDLLEVIGNNQERLVRHAPMAEAIYFNTEAPMALVTRVFETAVRNGVNLSHIAGYREIYESIFGREAARKLEKVPEEPLPPEIAEIVVTLEELPLEPEAGDKPGLDVDLFEQVMKVVTSDETGMDVEIVVEEAEKKFVGKKPLHALVEEMNVPQKVRLALVGNATARALLIKDPKAVVALSVLRSPQVTEGEVALFAKNKALSDRVIVVICRNRDWTRSASIQMSLIKHPKTPAGYTNRWVRALGNRHLKEIAKSREVPGHVSRLAKNLIDQRESGKAKGG